jgi:HAD superfamily hydrolase (TIGR01549 family)
MLTLEMGLPKELHHFINEMKQMYTMELVHSLCKPKFIHEYALSTLKAKGFKLAVASNSIKDTVQVMMQKAHLDRYLDLMLSASDVVFPKPNPEIYLTAIQRLGFSPSECVIVEDNENGIAAARASGAHVLEVHEVDDVNLMNIQKFISKSENEEMSR